MMPAVSVPALPGSGAGPKDLEMFGGSVPRGDLLFGVEVTTIQGKRRLLTGSAFRCRRMCCPLLLLPYGTPGAHAWQAAAGQLSLPHV